MTVAPIAGERLELVSLSAAFLRHVLAGRRREAEGLAGISLPDGWPQERDRGFLRLRAEQLERDPSARAWLVRAIVLREAGRPMIGTAGFHGRAGVNAKDEPGAVEVGYAVVETHRGRGYATEALGALVEWARDQGVRHVIASVAPDNAPSLAIVHKLGFRRTGEHWDEEDGPELEFELTLE